MRPDFRLTVRRLTVLLAAVTAAPLTTSARDLTLKEALTKAADASPEVESARLQGVAAQSRIDVARAAFLPTVNLEAVETTGFPGSTADLHLSGLVASPFRQGAAAGISATVPIWDFGRTSNAVDAAQHEAKVREEAANYERYRVYQTAMSLFYQCALFRDTKESWTELAADARLVRDVTMQFVKKGQRSIVERYLVDSEVERAQTQISVNDERQKMEINELSILTGLPAASLTCPHLPASNQALTVFRGEPIGNPIIRQAEESAKAAHARVSQARADYLPKLIATAGLGAVQDVRLIPDRQIYALGVAIVLPIFEGFRTNSQVDEASALAASAEKALESRKLQIAELNARYDKLIRASNVSLIHLRDEFNLAKQGFQTAKRRYFNLEGGVVDVREAFSNLSRTQIELLIELDNYLESSAAKAILNGTPF